ncbi:MAG: TIGR02453 family protein [Ignavibacteria bacterium RBG_16_34_14]|nr:MAG: TIGR02453 family protein [Ignavibacteria bacterium RBG_16_34_14]
MLTGFPFEAIKFLSKLKRNNTKEWFEYHREEFNNLLFEPAQEFVVVLGELLRTIAPDIIAIPKTDKSIFRLHRDVRFSKEKSPYKTNLGILFWEGERKKMECSGFYFHAEPDYMFFGAGIYMFNDALLKKYRDVIYNPDKAKELDSIINKLKKRGYFFGGKVYKRIPKGFDAEYPFSDYLLYNGFYVYEEIKDLKKLQKEDMVKFSLKKFKNMLPLHQWLVKNI